MGFASGLVSQLGWAVETTAGTAVVVSKFQPHISEGVKFEVNRAQGEGLYGSTNGVALLSRHVLTTKSVSGDFEVELTDKSLGTLWRVSVSVPARRSEVRWVIVDPASWPPTNRWHCQAIHLEWCEDQWLRVRWWRH